MNIAITGATGLVGCRLSQSLRAQGHSIRAISTRTRPRPSDLEDCQAVVNLAGEPVAQRWTVAARRRIHDSRINGTRSLVATLGELSQPPQVLVSASAVGFYGSRGDELLPESIGPASDFLGTLAVEWEHQAELAAKLGTRVVRLRISLVLDKDGGALAKMLPLFRMGIGGPIGSGRQWMSWIHLEDLVSLIVFAIENPKLRSAVNAASPNPVTNTEFTRVLARAVHRPAFLPVPHLALKILYGEMSEIIYASQRAIPEAALRAGFQFQYPDISTALGSCV